MQEDRSSLLPGRMTWSRSVRPPIVLDSDARDQIKSKWQMALTGIVAAALYIYLSHALLQGLIFWIVGSGIVIAYVVFVMMIWWERGKKVRNAVVLVFSSLLIAALFMNYIIPLF